MSEREELTERRPDSQTMRIRELEEEVRTLRESSRLLDKLARRQQRKIFELEDRLAGRVKTDFEPD